jgi:hypothetical protein
MSSLKLYENIVIGNYLFDLGVEMAKAQPELPLISLNLLQQTPADRTLADVLLANDGVCRIIEFKRAGKFSAKERWKLEALRAAIAQDEDPELTEELSRWIHWYVEIEAPTTLGEPLLSSACCYLDADDDTADRTDIHQFAASTAEGACGEALNSDQRHNIGWYVRWISRLFGAIERRDSADRGASGLRPSRATTLLVSVHETNGVVWMAVPSIEYALMNKVELAAALKLEIGPDGPEYKQKIEIEPETPQYEEKIDLGPKIGF